jgi:integrase/recombinase XerD
VAQQYLAQMLEEYRRLDRGGRPRRSYKEDGSVPSIGPP